MDTPIFVSDNVLDELESSSATPQERIKLLETRLQMLRQRIDKLTAQLEDERFLRESSNDTLEQCRQHIQTMTDEYDAIKSLLDKLA
jgi:chromosome segregation ATPase